MATIAINDTTPELTIEEQFPTEVTPETMSTTPMEQQGMVVTPNLIRAIPHIIVVGESGVGKTHFSKTARDGFVLDIEDGTGTEFDADHKITYNPGYHQDATPIAFLRYDASAAYPGSGQTPPASGKYY
jgi:hypothetical protein